MQPLKLLIFDFDGTALGGHEPYDMFPREFCRLLDTLPEYGIKWATNTTWAPEEQFEIIKKSGVKSLPGILTGQTGRLLGEVIDGELIMDNEYAKAVVKREQSFRRRHFSLVREITCKIINDKLVSNIHFNQFEQNIIAFSAVPGREKVLWKELAPLMESGLYYAWNPAKRKINALLPFYMNKGAATLEIQRRLKIRPGMTVVAGDETNDLHMFDPEIAAYMICPANSSSMIKDKVKKNGGIVATKKYSYGIVEAMNKLINMTTEKHLSECR